jgi:oligopeptide/dipeptide ABC transporter ATP-binding protein
MELQGFTKREAWRKAIEMLKKVRIPSPATVAARFPHQLSGGMCQRVMIAIALAAKPELLIADEPTTALDVTIQAQILQLLYEQQRDTKASILFITHDLGIVAQLCQSVAIMLEGQIVEQGPTKALFKHPLHPYTKGLLNSIPFIGRKGRLQPVEPSMDSGGHSDRCVFYSRCPTKNKNCRTFSPKLREHTTGHYVRCIASSTGEKS